MDRIDPWHRKSPPNRELVAQGLANMLSGFAGGLPVTSVIVRSSANTNAGARTRVSAFTHGALLLLAVVFAAGLLSRIPLACLATILLVTGYKLAEPKIFAEMRQLGWNHFIPFVVTIAAIVLTDLLKGIAIGLAVGVLFVLRTQMSRVFDVIHEGARVTIRFQQGGLLLHPGQARHAARGAAERHPPGRGRPGVSTSTTTSRSSSGASSSPRIGEISTSSSAGSKRHSDTCPSPPRATSPLPGGVLGANQASHRVLLHLSNVYVVVYVNVYVVVVVVTAYR